MDYTKSTFQYTHVAPYGNTLLVRGIDTYTHQRTLERVKFKPKLFKKTDRESEWKSLGGDNVVPYEFDCINDAKSYVKQFDGVHGQEIYGNQNYIQQFMATLPTSYDVSLLNVVIVDIETEIIPGMGIPVPSNPVQAILLISLYNRTTKIGKTFGVKPFDGELPLKWYYIQCSSEADLLNKFLAEWASSYPDVVSGWNSDGFDMPYIYARSARVVGEERANSLSPWGTVYQDVEKGYNNKEIDVIRIPGVSQLDLLALYKKYASGSRESWTLGFIAEHENVEVQKNTFEDLSGGFVELYTKHWNRFVLYNIDDVRVVDVLDNKLGYIDQHCSVGYEAKENFEDAYSPVKTWESIIYNDFERRNVVFDPPKEARSQSYDGAYVIEPIPKNYGWSCSVDATSLYPSTAITWNISPDTKLYRMENVNPQTLLDRVEAVERPEGTCIAANGVLFDLTKEGFIPRLFRYYFIRRKKVKGEMLALKKRLESGEYSGEDATNVAIEISRLNSMQNAFKLLLNSAYGALGNKFFRFFDIDLAEAITAGGQYIIRSCEMSLGRYLGNVQANVIAGDTDSMYIDLQSIVEKFIYPIVDRTDKAKIVRMIERYAIDKLQPAIQRIVNNQLEKVGFKENFISFKLEAIGDHILYVAKKRYVMRVLYNEGVYYHEPVLKVVGLEIVRSTTPKLIQNRLKESLNYILDGDQAKIIQYVKDVKKAFYESPINKISFTVGVNGLEKYKSSNRNGVVYVAKTPIYVRAALLYNDAMEKGKFDSVQYPMIYNGSKMKYFYLKTPNRTRENVFGFVGEIPPELGMEKMFDYDTMFDKLFLSPLSKMCSVADLDVEERSSLEAFFDD